MVLATLLNSLPSGILPALAVAFAAGALSFLTPCMLPLVPGYLSLISGVSATELSVATTVDQRRILRSTLLFIAGYALVFTAVGATASALGSVLADHRRLIDRVAGVAIIVMGLFLAGLVNPRFLQRERRVHVSPSALGAWAPPVMGMAFAFGWSPCVGPIFGSILLYAGDQGSVRKGIVLLLAYSLGLGVPFVASGLAFARLTGAFGWVKRHFAVINLVSGLLLVGFGLVLVTGRMPWVVAHVQLWLDALGLKRVVSLG
jgi:cytochrome c-type biogenesis protein